MIRLQVLCSSWVTLIRLLCVITFLCNVKMVWSLDFIQPTYEKYLWLYFLRVTFSSNVYDFIEFHPLKNFKLNTLYPWRLSTWQCNVASFPAATVMFGTCSTKKGSQLRMISLVTSGLPEANISENLINRSRNRVEWY